MLFYLDNIVVLVYIKLTLYRYSRQLYLYIIKNYDSKVSF